MDASGISTNLNRSSAGNTARLSILRFSATLSCCSTAVHVLATENNFLPNSDISEIAIVMSYLFYIILYYAVFRMFRKGKIQSKFRGAVVPAIATLGSLFILSGGLQNKLFPLYALFCIAVYAAALLFYKRRSAKE